MRTIALFGIIALNYHGYLNFQSVSTSNEASIFERWWHPFEGVLANPFPVGFVMVAGMGVSLLVGAKDSQQLIEQVRWRLARRGLFLFALGYGIDWVWPGTILPYYGAFFLIASVIATWSKLKLIALGSFSMIAAALVEWWRLEQSFDGNFTAWLSPTQPNTPRNLLLRIFIDYTHPLFPWLAFFITGILLGRAYIKTNAVGRKLFVISVISISLSYQINSIVNSQSFDESGSDERWSHLASTQPFDRGILYVAASIGVVIAVFMLVTVLCERYGETLIVRLAQTTGQMTLTIYLAHIFIYNAVVNWWHLVTPTGLDTAMTMSIAVYISAIIWANWWHHHYGRGPAERIYRHFGG
ncbi:membrane protein [Actinomycetes bacterium]|nr:membrane protein [Actinomycetes bacterium]